MGLKSREIRVYDHDPADSQWDNWQVLNARLAVLERPHHNSHTAHNATFSLVQPVQANNSGA